MRRLGAPYLLILPSFLLAGLIIVWPLKELVQIAAHDVNRFGQLRDFAGLANFEALFADPDFIASAWRTVVWTLGVVLGALLVSAPVALVLNGDFYGRGLARVIVMLPWAVSLTMTAIVWRWALSGESGMLNSALRGLGLMDTNVQWLATAATAFPMQILIGILATVPFTVTIFLGGLSSIQDELYDAAALEGAGQHHLRFQFLPDHLGNDPGRAGQFHRHSRHLPLQAGVPLGKAGGGGRGVPADVRHPAYLYGHLCPACHARG
jgi:multiple sugar transport system permease protein